MFGNLFTGRNGIDRYSLFLILISLPVFLYPYVWVLGLAVFGYSVFRIFSKNLDKRRKELYRFDELNRTLARKLFQLFQSMKGLFLKLRKFIVRYGTRMQQRKEYVFIKCPQCKKTLRLPRKKGKLKATCPVCQAEFFKKT